MRLRRNELSDAVPHDAHFLYLASVHPFRLENLDALHEFPDDLRRQFPDIRVLAHLDNGIVNIHAAFLLGGNHPTKLRNTAF